MNSQRMIKNEEFPGNYRCNYRCCRNPYSNVLLCDRIATYAMSTDRHCRYLSQDVHFFAAALSGALISVWEEDPAGVYVEAERGYIDKFTPDFVRVRNVETSVWTSYSRDTAIFERMI